VRGLDACRKASKTRQYPSSHDLLPGDGALAVTPAEADLVDADISFDVAQ
jgi:hypothetical protein